MPDQNASKAGEPAGTAIPLKPNPTHHILVVDDEVDILRLNVETLMDSGYHADAAEDGAVAWETLQIKSYHLLITDHDMPKVSGVDLLKKLHEADMTIPVIMATGTWPHHEFTRNPHLRTPAKLLKPHTITELLGAVKEILCAIDGARKQP